MIGRWCGLRLPTHSFQSAHGFSARALAYMLDSLVRVSRRVGGIHFLSILFPFSLSRRQGTSARQRRRVSSPGAN
jgi:hypothetical protein